MRPLLLIVLLVLGAGQSYAEVEIFFGEDLGLNDEHPNADAARDQFLGNLVTLSIEDFEGFPLGTTGTLIVDFEPLGLAHLYGEGCAVTNIRDAGVYPSSGDQFWFSALAVGQTVFPFTLIFENPQHAFGFFATDIGDYGAQVVLTLDGSTTVTIPASIHGPSGSFVFFGIVCRDVPFAEVAIDPGLYYDGAGYDDLIVGSLEQVIASQQSTWGSVKTLYR
jgi:hypothetical protein